MLQSLQQIHFYGCHLGKNRFAQSSNPFQWARTISINSILCFDFHPFFHIAFFSLYSIRIYSEWETANVGFHRTISILKTRKALSLSFINMEIDLRDGTNVCSITSSAILCESRKFDWIMAFVAMSSVCTDSQWQCERSGMEKAASFVRLHHRYQFFFAVCSSLNSCLWDERLPQQLCHRNFSVFKRINSPLLLQLTNFSIIRVRAQQHDTITTIKPFMQMYGFIDFGQQWTLFRGPFSRTAFTQANGRKKVIFIYIFFVVLFGFFNSLFHWMAANDRIRITSKIPWHYVASVKIYQNASVFLLFVCGVACLFLDPEAVIEIKTSLKRLECFRRAA